MQDLLPPAKLPTNTSPPSRPEAAGGALGSAAKQHPEFASRLHAAVVRDSGNQSPDGRTSAAKGLPNANDAAYALTEANPACLRKEVEDQPVSAVLTTAASGSPQPQEVPLPENSPPGFDPMASLDAIQPSQYGQQRPRNGMEPLQASTMGGKRAVLLAKHLQGLHDEKDGSEPKPQAASGQNLEPAEPAPGQAPSPASSLGQSDPSDAKAAGSGITNGSLGSSRETRFPARVADRPSTPEDGEVDPFPAERAAKADFDPSSFGPLLAPETVKPHEKSDPGAIAIAGAGLEPSFTAAVSSHATEPAGQTRPAGDPGSSSASLVSQVAPAAIALTRGAQSERLTIQLHPAELGHLEIRIDRPKDAAARVEILVERPETLSLLVRDQQQLQHALNQAGVPAEGRSVTLQIAAKEVPASGNVPSAQPETGSGQRGSSGFGQQRGGSGGRGRERDTTDLTDMQIQSAVRRWFYPGLNITA